MRAHARWGRIGQLDRPDLYLRRMITNGYLSWRRRWSVRSIHPVADTGQLDRATAPDPAVRLADQDEVSRLLATLNRRQRVVLVLRFYEGRSDEEIAEILGCAAGTVRSHVSRALAGLRERAGRTPSPGGSRVMIDTGSIERALGSLERYAPDEADVLAGFRRGVARRRRRRQVAGVTGMATVVAVFVVMQNSFVPALLVTGGDPANATLTAPLLIYRRAFEYGELGYASTLSVILLVLTGIAAALPLWLAARQLTRA